MFISPLLGKPVPILFNCCHGNTRVEPSVLRLPWDRASYYNSKVMSYYFNTGNHLAVSKSDRNGEVAVPLR